MTIESKSITEEYAKEYINMLVEINRLRINPQGKVIDWFRRFPRWIAFASAGLLGCGGWLGFYLYRFLKLKLFSGAVNYIIFSMMLTVFVVMMLLFIRNIRTYSSMLKMKSALLSRERNVIYRFDENGFVFEDVGTKIVMGSWDDVDFAVARPLGCYLVGKDFTKFGLIRVPDSEYGSLGDFLIDYGIQVKLFTKRETISH